MVVAQLSFFAVIVASVLVLQLPHLASATTEIVVDWQEFVFQKPIQVSTEGDFVIKFVWPEGQDYTVTEFINEDDWNKCDFTGPTTKLSVTSPYYLVPDSESDLYIAGWEPERWYYFGCETGKHCRNRDMKIKVYTGILPTTTTTTTTSTSTTSTTTTATATTTTSTTVTTTTTTSTSTTTTTAEPDYLLSYGAGTCGNAEGCTIETAAQCQRAAVSLGVSDTTVNQVSYPSKAPGCTLNAYGDLTFNTQTFANANEATSEQTVICIDCGVRSCPSDCYGATCDTWTEQFAITCDELESEYACECGGCLCWYDAYKYSGGKKKSVSTVCATPCDRLLLAGDGYCDDENNVCGCDWDGGDCCRANPGDVLTTYCTDCQCLDEDFTDFCKYGCGNPVFQGDSFCDDNNNHCGCDWDGGDCCGAGSTYAYCTDCECKDPDNELSATCNSGCFKEAWVGDGFCDDGNNNCGCDWDAGDCCGIDNIYTYCKYCACLEPNYFIDNPKSGRCTGECQKPWWQGDGFCDDGNNVCGCDWDMGDCCDLGARYTSCKYCECADLYYVPDCDSTCRFPNWVGDGICDDGNNHCGCDWDGGDCCGNNNMNVCSREWDSSHKTDRDRCGCEDPNHQMTGCDGYCKVAAWQGDGVCDVENNNCGCDWDSGDCCDPASSFEYCAGDEACACLDGDAQTGCNIGCFFNAYAGDGYCDDENNHCGCDWDGGDCCTGLLTFCVDCECLDPNVEECSAACGAPEWVGDFTCDDENNNCGCGWDGGDCCGTSDLYDFSECTDCECRQPANCQGECEYRAWVSDKYCDDGNNNCGCGWDGGDCCKPSSNYNYCTECECISPDSGTYEGAYYG